MNSQPITTMPIGYDDLTTLTLRADNTIVATHPVMPPLIYDEQVMRWVHAADDEPQLQQKENPHD